MLSPAAPSLNSRQALCFVSLTSYTELDLGPIFRTQLMRLCILTPY